MSAIVADYSVEAIVNDAKRKAGRSRDYQAGLSLAIADALRELQDARDILHINATMAADVLSNEVAKEDE